MLMADSPDLLDGVGDVYHVSGLHWRGGHGQRAMENYLHEKEIFAPCAAAALYRRDIFLEAGGFDEQLEINYSDIDA
jgi:N-acetylglucosaminyl-diphospho-decaprenol L-rhamnosyltransferase